MRARSTQQHTGIETHLSFDILLAFVCALRIVNNNIFQWRKRTASRAASTNMRD